MYDIVILTDHRYVNPEKIDWYIQQVLDEDALLMHALEKKGLKVCKKDWADSSFDWARTKYAIFRSTWDYFDRFDAFFRWLEKTKRKTTFINTASIIHWNIDKYYLKELADKGVNIAPTFFIEKGKQKTLYELFEETKWETAVIKPTISGAARHTYKITPENCNQREAIFQQLISKENMLFQQYLNNITEMGEISLVMIGGEYTHAVKKIAKKGDFRVQDDHGGTVEEYLATKEEIAFAKLCLEKCPFHPIYARVDVVYDNNMKPSLSELELIEPELWFRNNPKSAELLAEGIANLTPSK